ncbi:T9SS type A sorting domain-containing protein [Patiriisocius marinus]|uniref:T9SS type A sorting domain-containing protein n=1 Tax=Patiriisocius marinus TaxID=1397112 RepID=UPI00232C799F|nr:GEVED domain-containing protein [Patiriisocius marinus]
MKKITKLLMIACLALFSWQGSAQNDTCALAATLQLDANCGGSESGLGLNSGDPTGNDGTDGNVCSANYSGGDDFIYEYTATTTDALALSLWATNSWTGLMVTEGCPTTGTCFASSASSSVNESLETPAMTIGVTYYIQISTYPTPQSAGQFCLDASLVSPPMPPVNDTCATATDLALETSPLTASITDLASATEDISCLTTAGRDVFYSIEVPSLYTFSFNQVSNTFDSTHRVAYGGVCGDTELECQDSGEFNVTEWTNDTGSDQTVFIVIEGYYGTTYGDFTFQWSLLAPPACPDVANLNTDTSSDGIIALDWDDAAGASSYSYEIQPDGALQGASGALVNSTSITSDANVASGILTDGSDYTLYVTSDCAGALGNYQSLDFTYRIPPSNDSCVSPMMIMASLNDTCANKVSGTTYAATTNAVNGCSTTGKDVWYEFAPSETGIYNFSVSETLDIGSNTTYLTLYTGVCGSLTQVGPTSCFNTSSYSDTFMQGTTYLVNIRSSSSTAANYVEFDLCIEQIETPDNDNCEGAIDLALETSPLSASITMGVSNTDETSCLRPQGRDLFYKILVPDTYEFSINQVSNTFDSVHRVAYGGTCPGDTELICTDGGEFDVTEWTNDTGADQTVYIIIENYYTNLYGDFTMQWSVEAPPACLEPTVLLVSNVTTAGATVSWTPGDTETTWEYVVQPVDTGLPTTMGTPVSGMPTVDISTLMANTSYEVYIRAVCGMIPSAYAGPVDFYTGHCQVSGNNSNSYIDSFSTTGGTATNISNASTGYGTDGYQDNYDTMSVTSYETGSISFTSTTVGNTVGAAIWIDWNNDLQFETSERVYNFGGYTSNPSGDISVPSETPVGDYRMRILIDYNSQNPSPCSFGSGRGEAEDYKFIVTSPPACASPSNPSISLITDTTAEGSWSAGIVTANYDWIVVASGDGATGTAVVFGSTSDLTAAISGLTAENDYDFFIKSDCEIEYTGPASFTTFATPPVNDSCSNPISITASTDFDCANQLSGTTNAATITAPDGCSTTGKDVWYSYTPLVTSLHSISVTETLDIGFNSTYVSVYTGDCGTLTQQGASCFSTSYNGELTQGITYLINVRSTSTTVTNYVEFDLCVVQLTSPENDSCFNANPLSLSLDDTCANKVSGTTAYASTTAPDGCSTTGKDVWYTFTAPSTANYLFAVTETDEVGFNSTYVTLYTGSCGTLTQVGASCSTTTILESLTQGVEYLVNVRSTNTTITNYVDFDLCVREAIAPENDEFDDATELIVGTTCTNISGSLVFATNSPESASADCGSTDGLENDVWYKFVAPANGNIVVESSEGTSGTLDTVMVLYDTDGTTQLACNDDFVSGIVYSGIAYQDLTPGDTYFVEIHEYDNNNSGSFNICAYSPDCSGDTVTWNGTAWSPNVPTTNDVAIINGTYTATSANSLDVCSIIINPGRTLNVSADGYIQTSGDITVNGTLNVNHQGSVVQIDATAETLNNGTINVNITTPLLNEREFMLLGSPMDASTGTTFDGAYQVLTHNTSLYTMFDDAPIAGVNFYDDDGNDLSPLTGTMEQAAGYIVRPSYTQSDTYDYTFEEGTLNSGNITYTAGYNGNKDDSANFLSNPYPSAIDATAFLDANSGIISEIYFWDHLTAPGTMAGPYGEQNFNMEDISTLNSMGGTAATGGTVPTNIISTAQGFGIKANAGGDIIFKNSMRLTSGNSTLRSPIEDANRLWLNVREESNNLSSMILIGFTNAATEGFDVGFDTEKIGTAVSLYTHLQDGTQNLSIQSREAFDSSMTIPMGFSTYFDDELTYTISISNFEGNEISSATVYLIDNLLGTTTNLSEGDYTFTSSADVYNSRFTVLFENSILNTNEISLSAVAIYPNPAKDVLNVASPNAEILSIEITDLRGRAVVNQLINANTVSNLDVSNLDSAIYLVTIKTVEGSITKKFVKE